MTFSTRNLAFGTVAFAVGFTACGGGRVVVNTPAPSAVVASVPTTPAPSGFVVSTVPLTPAPPAPTQIAPSPGPDYIRIEGYYNWLGDHYEWVPATWVKIPHPGATYVPGHWQSTANGYVWTPGYWQ
jgi:WXXGXW repeat (2 copies)